MSANRIHVEVPERLIYVGGAGPAMGPPTLLPSADGDRGWKIVGTVKFTKDSQHQYIISPKHNPAYRKAIKQQDIRNWISQRDVEAFDFAQTSSDSDLDWHAQNQISEQPEKPLRKKLDEKMRQKNKGTVAIPRHGRNFVYQKSAEDAAASFASGGKSAIGSKSGLNGTLKRKRSTAASGPGLKRKHSALFKDFFSSGTTETALPSLPSPFKQLVAMKESDDDLEIHETLSVQPSPRLAMASQRLKKDADIAALAKRHHSQPLSDGRVTRSRSSSVSYLPPHIQVERPLSRKSSPAIRARDKTTPISDQSLKLQNETRATERQESVASTVSSNASKKSKGKSARSRFTRFKNTKKVTDEQADWEIKGILEDELRREKGKMVQYYQVDWEGNWDPTWEPAKNVSADAIEEYEKRINSELAEQNKLMFDGEGDSLSGADERSQKKINVEDIMQENNTPEDDPIIKNVVPVGVITTQHTTQANDLPITPETISRNGHGGKIHSGVSNSTDGESSQNSDFERFTNFLDEQED